MQRNVHGLDSFVWAIGVVEDRFDPLLMGRCKVRYLHHNTQDKNELPTEVLPWSIPAIPLNNGTNVVGPLEGDWVLSFFRDGILAQQPVMLAVLPGIPEKIANPTLGFFDPRPDSLLTGHKVPRDPEPPVQHDDGSGTVWEERDPKSRFPEERFLKESRFSRLGRNEFVADTIVEQKKENRFIGQIDVPTADHPAGTGTDEASGGAEFSEPEIPYSAKYPYNKVYQSEGGHFIEIDDTPGAERIHIYHRIGSFIEIHPTGLKVTKNVQDDFEITLRSKFEHIEASRQETVDWFKKTYVNKDKLAGFNYDQTVGAGGNFNITTEDGKVNVYSNGDINVYSTKDMHVETLGNLNFIVGKDWNVVVKGNYNLSVAGNRSAKITGMSVTMASAISDIAQWVCTRYATLNISDTSPIISHNAFVTSCTGTLLGVTLDDDGDVTPAGAPGCPPIFDITDAASLVTVALGVSTTPVAVPLDITTMMISEDSIAESITTPLEVVSSFVPVELAENPNFIPGLDSVESLMSAVGGMSGLVTMGNNLGSISGLSSLISTVGTGNFSSFLGTVGGGTGLSSLVSGVGGLSTFTSFVAQTGGQFDSIFGALGGTSSFLSTISSLGGITNTNALISSLGAGSFSEVISSLGGINSLISSLTTIGGMDSLLSITSMITGSSFSSAVSAIGGLANLTSLISQFGSADSVGQFLSVIGGHNLSGILSSIGGLTQLSSLITVVGTAEAFVSFVDGIGGGDVLSLALEAFGGISGLSSLITQAGSIDAAQSLISGVCGGFGSSLPTK